MNRVLNPTSAVDLTVPIGFLIELSEAEDRQGVFDAYARWVRGMLGADRATVAMAEGDGSLALLAIEGNQAIPTGSAVPLDGTMIGRVCRSRLSETCVDLAGASHLGDCAQLAAGGLQACMDAPLVAGDRCFGALAVAYIDASAADPDKLLLLEAVARSLASYILLHEQMQSLADLSLTDPLTKCFNRRHFQQVSSDAWTRWSGMQEPMAMAIIDLDHFKTLNDTHGHEFGDEVLRRAAAALRQSVRDDDVVVRMGGEEFGVLMPCTEIEEAVEIAEANRTAIADLMPELNGTRVRVTASVGVAALDASFDSIRAMAMAADEALYRAKSAGRNRVEVAG